MQNDFHLPEPTHLGRLKITAIVAVLLAGGIIAIGTVRRASDKTEAQQWTNAVAIPTVHLVPVETVAATNGLTLPGTMQAWNTAKIYAQVNGYVKAWYKDIGSQVANRTALGVIQTPELDQQIVQARATLTKAQSDVRLARSTSNRWSELLSSRAVSKQEAEEKNGDLSDKQAEVKAEQANLDRLVAMKAFSTLRAPFAGAITLRSADIGDFVGPNADNHQPLFAVSDTHAIRVYVSVPQSYSANIKPGLAVALTVPDFPNRVFTAHLVGDAGAVDPQMGTFQIQLLIDNADHALRPGGYAQVKFALPTQSGTVAIPSSTLIFRAAGTQIATVGQDGRVQMHSVTIGHDLGSTVEVTSGLDRKARLIDNPPDSIEQGELVRITKTYNG